MRSLYIDMEHQAIVYLVRDEVMNRWLITRIHVPAKHRGKGVATALISQVLADADREGATLQLWVKESGGLTREQLTAWYRRLGFEQEFILMVRRPQ